MPALAALINPLIKNTTNIQVFYNTDNFNLAMVLKAGRTGGLEDGNKYISAANDQKGIIKNPSDLAVANFDGMQFVIGITEPNVPAEKQTTHNLSILSPVYKPLVRNMELDNNKVTFCAKGNEGWVFYLKGTTQDTTQLVGYGLKDLASGRPAPMKNLMVGTALASYVDSNGDIFVIYQDYKRLLREFKKDENDALEIKVNTPAVAGTRLAVAYSEIQNKAWLYYIADDGNVFRVQKSGKDWENASTTKIPTKTPVGDNNQFAVVHANDNNHLFYLPEGSENIVHICDPAAPAEGI